MITSVLGDVDPGSLGPTDCHDHLFIRGGHAVTLEPGYLLDDVSAAVAEAETVLAAGGAALVDCMPLGVGRDADGLVEVASRTGLTVLAASGFHRDAFYPDDHWVRRTGTDALAAIVVSEYERGMGRDGVAPPDGDRSTARPGVIKVATSGETPTELERRLLVAVGLAAAETGLPVITHTETVAGARAQLAALAARGVPAERVVLSHMDRHADAAELAEICRTGATVCLDWLGRTDRRPDEVIVRLAASLVEAGLGDRVVLGQDLARRAYWRSYGGGPGLAHLFATVLPLMTRMGFDRRELDTILVTTPRRVFDHEAEAA